MNALAALAAAIVAVMTAIDHPLVRSIVALDGKLVAAGWPALSPWWLTTFARFVLTGCRQLVVRAGRRAGKSSSLCVFAVAFALAYDATLIPPSDLGIVAFISTRQDEAAQRLRTIKAILDVVGVKWKPIEGGIELLDRRIAFKVFPASVSGVSGFTAILVIADEVAKWRDLDTGANPATEVLASVRPTMATQRDARMVLSSSPLSNEDAHAKAFDLGETAHQVTAFAETWIANPSLTERELRRDEPDGKIFSREYAAIPGAAVSPAFERDHVLAAFTARAPEGRRYEPFGVVDVASGRSDGYGYGVAQWVDAPDGNRRLVFTFLGVVEGKFWSHDAGERIVTRISFAFLERGVRRVFGDQRESLMTASAFERNRLRFHEVVWTGPSKERGVATLRRWLAEGRLVFAAPHTDVHTKMRDQLLSFEERISASGAFTYGARGRKHDDLVALLVTTAAADKPRAGGADAWPGLDGSPINPGNKLLNALSAVNTADVARTMAAAVGPVRPRTLPTITVEGVEHLVPRYKL